MPDCYLCNAWFIEGVDGKVCRDCKGPCCEDCFEDHVCTMRVDGEDAPLEFNILPETKELDEPPEEMEEDLPKLPSARGLNTNAIDEDYRKIGVATWNLHGLNDRRYPREDYGAEIPNRLKALGASVNHVIEVVKEAMAPPEEIKTRLRKSTQKKSPFQLAVPRPSVTDEDIAVGLAASIMTFWQGVEGRKSLAKLNQAPSSADLQELVARLQNLAGGNCSVATATECIILRTRVRRIVGTENAWKNGCKQELHARKDHPLCGVLDALSNLDQSLNTHLIIAHINQMMDKNPWLDAFILQEVRPDGLKVLTEQLDKKLRITSGPCMAGVATTLNQREYYPVVTRESTIKKVTVFAIPCVKDRWSEPDMPKGSKARSEPWPLDTHEVLNIDVYSGPENGKDELDTINILWSKECKVYRPVVVYELETENGDVAIGNVHTSPGDGDDEWWRYHEYDQLEEAFEVAGHDGFWLMGGDYYLSAESRVQRSETDLSVTELEDDDTYNSVLDLFEEVTGKKFDPEAKQGTKRRKLEKETISELTIGEAQMSVFKTNSEQVRPKELRALEKTHRQQLQPFGSDFHEEITNTKRLDQNQTSEDIFRNVLGLTFKKTLPDQWKIAQAISGTNTHLKIHDLPGYAFGSGKVSLPCIERARRFTRARVTSKMRIADFFLFNRAWKRPDLKKSLACKIGLLAPVEVGSGCGIYWYDEENLAISRYWMAISDHFPVGGVFTTDLAEPVLKELTAAPFVGAPVKPSTLPPIVPKEETHFELWEVPQDGDCFFASLKEGLGLMESVDDIRQYALLEDSKIPKTYVGWPDWEAVAQHYGVTVVVHEYHYGQPDYFVRLLDEVNPGKQTKVHMRLIHIKDQSASHMDLMIPFKG